MSTKAVLLNVLNKVRLSLGTVLLLFYIIVGCLFLFTDIWIGFFPKGKEFIGAVLLLFGALRFYVAFRRYKKSHKKIQNYKISKQKNVQPDKEEAKEDVLTE